MKKLTQKQILARIKELDGKICILSFENGIRYSGCSCCGLFAAFDEIQKHLKAGRQIVIMTEESDKKCFNYETQMNKRVSYEFAKQFATKFLSI